MIKQLIFIVVYLICFGCLSQNKHPIAYNPFWVKVFKKDSLLYYDNLLEGLNNPKTEWIYLNERIDITDTIINLLERHENLVRLDFSPLQNPELIPLLSEIPNLKSYNFPLAFQNYAVPNLENSNLKLLNRFTFRAQRSWESLYDWQTRSSIFSKLEYVNFVTESTLSADFDPDLFQNLKYIDVSLQAHEGIEQYLKKIGYFPNIYGLIPFDTGLHYRNDSVLGFRLLGQKFYGYREELGICGMPNLEYLAFEQCLLPKKLYFCEMPLQTLIFNKTAIPKIKDTELVPSLKKLEVESSSNFTNNLKAHKRFPNLKLLKITDRRDTWAFLFPPKILAKTILKNNKTAINSRKLSKLNQLTHYELYGVKDRSLGFKLPKEKNNLTTLKIEKSGLWWPPKNLGEYKSLDTLILEVAFYRKNRLKKALLNLPNLKYVRINSSRYKEKNKKIIRFNKEYNKGRKGLAPRPNYLEIKGEKFRIGPDWHKGTTDYENEIIKAHNNQDLDIKIEIRNNTKRSSYRVNNQ